MSDNNNNNGGYPSGDGDDDRGGSNSNSDKRHSQRRKSKSGHRRSSTTKSPRRSSTHKSDKNSTRGGDQHSPRRSVKGSSRRFSSTKNNKTSESSSKTTQNKLRLAAASEGILPPPSLTSPNGAALKSPNPSDKAGDNSGRSGRRSSRYSRSNNKTPNSKSPSRNKKESRTSKLRMAGPGAVAAPPSMLPDPSASSATAGSSSTTPGASFVSPGPSFTSSYASTATSNNMTAPNVPATRMAQDINNSDDQWGGATPLEAVAAPNINEIEAARLQGREEGRREKEQQRRNNNGDNIVFMAAPATDNDKTGKKYAFAAFVIVVVAAAIVVWQVMRSNSSDAQGVGPTPFQPPTQDECLATSQGLVILGQKDMPVRTFAVEINFAVKPDLVDDEIKLAFLQKEVELKTQKYVLPLLIGCQIDGPIIIENNNFVIANAILDLITMDNPESCDLGSDSLCSFAYMEMDLFLKDPDVSSDYILELITFVFQHEGLLGVLDLLTPVETIETQREYEVLAKPSSLPTPSPSIKPSALVEPIPIDGNLPSKETCLDIAAGKDVEGQQDLALQEYDIYMDVILDILEDDLTTVTSELEEKLQQFLMPALAGCDPSFFLGNTAVPGTAPDGSPMLDNNSNRRLATEGLVLNARVEAEYLITGLCLPESNPPCYRYVIHLDIFVLKIVASADFTDALMAKFREEPLVPRLGLLSPFVRITVVDTVAQTPSAMPSFSPSAFPTTLAPSQAPSALPSESPSATPSLNPTPQPTPRPTQTPPPTPRPTPRPTPFPTPRPTERPTTLSPTPSPTQSPTPNPTASPTKTCIQSNTDLITAANVYSPYYSGSKAAIVAQYGPIEDWCFGPGVTSMASLFEYFTDFNEDLSNWDVSGITDMSSMFNSAHSFNQNIGGWDVSSVTNMDSMFSTALAFNQNIGGWDVSSVTNMRGMFDFALAFNRNIGGWDVSSVTDMGGMFSYASAFNQDLSNWDLTSLGSMERMFQGASNFNQSLCDWDTDLKHTCIVTDAFDSTNCLAPWDPNLYWYPPYSPGPFCHTC